MSFKKILVPFDFSDYSVAAIEQAGRVAKLSNGRVDVMHALHVAGKGLVASEQERARLALTDAVVHLQDQGIDAHVRLEVGEPGEAIVAAAADGYDMVVLGTHGRTGLAHLLLGSVAETVVRQATCPVMTVRCPK